MGLFDGYMPGESSGMPTGILGGWQGALEGNNPMLNIGLGILANNSGNYGSLGAALGKGAQQGIQNTQASRQAQQQAALYKLQMAKHQKDMLEAEQQAKFGEEFKKKNPDLAGYYDIDPKGAYKLANPQMNADGVDNVYLPTPNGILRANKKNSTDFGYLNIDGKPVMRSQDDPALRGAVKNAEAQAGANWNMYDGIEGSRVTEAQAAEMARGGNPAQFAPQQPQAMPLPHMPTGMPQNMQIPPEVQKQRDDVRTQILLAEQKSEGGAGKNKYLDQEISNMRGSQLSPMGIRVPTKLETKQGEADIDLAKSVKEAEEKSRINIEEQKTKDTNKISTDDAANVNQRKDALKSVQRARALLKAGIHSGGYSSINKGIEKYTPFVDKQRVNNTEEFISEIGNTVVPRLKEFGGNDSNEEMRYLKSIMGGDISLEKSALDSILKSSEEKIQRGIDRHNRGLDSDGKKTMSPKDSKMPAKSRSRADILKQYGVR